MKRLLIAMLALLTGLAVQTVPATARAEGLAVGAEIGATTGIRAAKVVHQKLATAAGRLTQYPSLAEQTPAVPRAVGAFVALTVRLGSDRARE